MAWGSQTFNIGPAGVNNVVELGGASITLPAGKFTSLEILGASASGHFETQTFYVHYTDGTYDTFTQAFSDWRNGYTGTAGSTALGETIVDTMTSFNTAAGQTMGTVYLYGYVFPLNPALTVASLQVPNDLGMKILAIDEVDQPAQVNMGAGTNVAGIADNQPGITTTNTYNEGSIDAAGESFSAAAQPAGLGSTVTWNQQTFAIGPADYNDIMEGGGASINLPEGNFTSLQLLGASVSGHFEPAMLYVRYTDGSYDTFTQDFSDWKKGYNGTLGSTAPGESIALAMTSYNNPTGTVNQDADLYGYTFQLNPAKTVDYLQITTDSAIKVLAIDEVDQPEQVNLGDAINSASPAFNTIGISMPGKRTCRATALTVPAAPTAARRLGNTVTWNSQTFDIEPAAATSPNNNVIAASGSPSIALPKGYYTSVQFLATSAGGIPPRAFSTSITPTAVPTPSPWD